MTNHQLTETLYLDLRQTARRLVGRERPGHILEPEALVHEAWLRLSSRAAWQDSGHFRAAAARQMRNILIDHGRRNASLKHGPRYRVALHEASATAGPAQLPPFEVCEHLDHLRLRHPLSAKVVELKVFAGLTLPETARSLRISLPAVRRLWAFAANCLRERAAL
jgi:RNA polymerase sigma factor (TIGR02999 family)